MNMLFLLALVVGVSLAAPIEDDGSVKASFGLAIDTNIATSTGTFSCYRSSYNVLTAFIRIYKPDNGGSVDPNGATNVQNANNAGLGVEVYITPSPTSSKQGYQQLDEAYNYVTSHGVNVKSVWLQVTSPINWGSNTQNNANFIYSFLARAQQRNLGVGIYTNSYDWAQITNGWTGWTSVAGGVNLWYWHVTATGPSGQTSQNFNDFASFGGWNNPVVKQYGQSINMCGNMVNADVYVTGSKKSERVQKVTDDEPIVVGLLMDA
uniref:Lysozyme n=1 Tax=Plectus sambesii TaxID=2011161 RepID=A0A914WGM6_9BILA